MSFFLSTSALKGNNTVITNLKCEYATNPIGLDIQSPRLSWQIDTEQRGVLQTSYQIIVSQSEQELSQNTGNFWNSGTVNSQNSTGIEYNGPELMSRQRYYWKVRVWTNSGEVSEWSEPAYFEMGLLKPGDWKSGWIAYVPGIPGRVLYFKTTFHKERPIKQARAYVSGLGFYEMQINERKVGDRVLEPGQSTYPKRIYYSTYDVTEYFSTDDNVVLISVAPGWYGSPSLRVQIEVIYTDGSQRLITSNNMRHVTTGPIVYSTIFDGETYDARLAVPDLYKPGIPTGLMNRDWAWAHNSDDPGKIMVSQHAEPIKIIDTIVPAAISEPVPGIYVIDAGRNLAGWAALKVQGERGTEINLKFAESLYENGLVNQENLRNAKAEDIYILSGNGIEYWHPSFTYHGFRYVQVEGFPYPPGADDIAIHVVRSAVAETGKFVCSNKLLNDIHQMIVNTEASNLHSVPTDCPQRDERMGWLNDLTVRIEQAIYNFDMSRFYPKFMDDIEDTQDEEGSITCVAPFRFGMRPADPVSASYLLLAWKCYEFYGDERIIRDHYDGMKAWIDYLNSRTENGIVNYSYYGDWCPPRDFLLDPNGSGVSRDTPGKMISTGYLYYCAKLLSDMAKIIKKDDEATHYMKLASEIASAFNREYWNEQTGGYASNNQASNAFALYMKLVPPDNVQRVVANLAENVKSHNYHLTTGNLCTKYLLETLTEYGHAETAYKIATRTTYPGWGFMLSEGATTLWERWEYATGDAMNSHNHPMMGSVDTWFYKYVLGINPDSRYPGFSQFVIKPVIFDDLTFAEGELNTVKGLVKVAWRKNSSRLNMNVSIPANTTAIVYLPAKTAKAVTENGRAISKLRELEILKEDNGYVALRAGSGNYRFEIKK
ncbi:MAG: family 78 glycoside hydrolase catalytic domain [Bacteroidales bacterium]|nr:family 78 glycoside hydrolase catalytic domain [Bacteroidales bacterium]